MLTRKATLVSIREVATETSPGVFHAREWGLSVDACIIDLLTAEARATEARRARLCMHPEDDSLEQQMLIVMGNEKPYPPHCHPAKQETLLAVRGSAVHETYSPDGLIIERTIVSPTTALYLNTPAGRWHSLSVTTEWFVFWEIARGPFTPESTVHADWQV